MDNEQTKEHKKNRRREIRNALTMTFVMVAMLSTATYAWFTLTDSPTVTGLQMTAATSSGLKVCESENGTYVDAVAIATNSAHNKNPQELRPVTYTSTGKVFQKPVYEGNAVTSLENLATDALEGHVAKYVYYLKGEAEGNASTLNVGLITGDPKQSASAVVEQGIAKAAGSFVRQRANSTDDTEQDAANAIRIGLLIGNSTDLIIYEPNCGIDDGVGSSASTVDATRQSPTSNVISNGDGLICNTGGTANTPNTNVSDSLFTLTNNTATKVTMYIWLEGTDADCVDEIQTDEMEAQIQFTVIEDATP